MAALPTHSYSFLCVRTYSRQVRTYVRTYVGTHILTDVHYIYVHTYQQATYSGCVACMRDDHQLQATFDNIHQYTRCNRIIYVIMHLVPSRIMWLRAKTLDACFSRGKLTCTMKAKYYESLPEAGHPLMWVVQTHNRVPTKCQHLKCTTTLDWLYART